MVKGGVGENDEKIHDEDEDENEENPHPDDDVRRA